MKREELKKVERFGFTATHAKAETKATQSGDRAVKALLAEAEKCIVQRCEAGIPHALIRQDWQDSDVLARVRAAIEQAGYQVTDAPGYLHVAWDIK